jgi:hypothetical protein
VAAILGGPDAGFAAFAGLGGTAAALALGLRRQLRRADPRLVVAAAVALGLLLAPHSLVTDFVLQVPALALVGRRSPRLATLGAALLSIAYLMWTLEWPSPLCTLVLAASVAIVLAHLRYSPALPPCEGTRPHPTEVTP